MPLFGAQMSIAGGLHNAVLAAQGYGMDAVQLFTASPRVWPVTPLSGEKSIVRSGKFLTKSCQQWKAKDLTAAEISIFRSTFRKSGVRLAMAHDCYLINLASPQEALYRQSLEAFIVEYARAEQLELRYLVTHPGSHIDSGEEAGLARVAQALDEVHGRCPKYGVQVLLEVTAGQGSNLGHRFEHLAKILSLVREPNRLGVCLDTCHVFAAGYALSPEKEYQATMRAFDRTIGLKRLRAFHLNDSQKPLDSRVDRHAHIGRGCLGLEPFRLLVNDPRFRRHPMVLETPKEKTSKGDMDAVNLRILRGLLRQN